jgi:hypothetical protein
MHYKIQQMRSGKFAVVQHSGGSEPLTMTFNQGYSKRVMFDTYNQALLAAIAVNLSPLQSN